MANTTQQRSFDVIHPNGSGGGGGAQPRTSTRRVLYGVVAALVAVAIVAIKYSQANKAHAVLSVKSAVAVGQVITAGDLGEASLPDSATIPSLRAGQEAQVIGQVAQAPLYPGDVLDPHQVASAPALPAGDVALTLALTPEQAVGGTLHPGDTVAVFAAASNPPPGTSAGAVQVLAGVPVRAVSTPSTVGGSPSEYITLQLTVGQATSLDAAYRAAKIDLALLGR